MRFKFKPITPIANWREEATDMLEKLFAAVQPDNLSMEMLFFNSVAELKELFDASLFDPQFVDMMEKHEAAGHMTDLMHPIPEDYRVQVYEHYAHEVQRLSPRVRVSICNETVEMWDELGPRLGMTPEDYVCGCGPTSVPGNPLFAPRSA